MAVVAEYIWIDGAEPTRQLRSKTKIMFDGDVKIVDGEIDPSQFPDWGFDGSSTGQAEGDASDCKLKPVVKENPNPCCTIDTATCLAC